MPHLIKVTNHNDFTISEMYDGIPYVFAKDKPINVPLEAMAHIFGAEFPADQETLDSEEFKDQVFKFVSKRFGWNVHQIFDNATNRWRMSGNVMAENREKFDNIEFLPVIFKMVEVKAEEQLPASRVKSKPGKHSEEEAVNG